MQPQKNDDLVEGPGANNVAEKVAPSIDGLDENYYVEILNPLSKTFRGKVATTRPTNAEVRIVRDPNMATITQNEDDIRRNYGLDLNNPDHTAKAHFTQTIDIPPGGTIRLPGNEAQVILRQLVNVVMDKRERGVFKGEPASRKEVEEELIIKKGTMSEFFQTQQVDLRKVINREQSHESSEEQSFPSEVDAAGDTGKGRSGGRRAAVANPKPGTGVNY